MSTIEVKVLHLSVSYFQINEHIFKIFEQFFSFSKSEKKLLVRTLENLDFLLTSNRSLLGNVWIVVDDLIEVNKLKLVSEFLNSFLGLMEFHGIPVILISNFKIRESLCAYELDTLAFFEITFPTLKDSFVLQNYLLMAKTEYVKTKIKSTYAFYSNFFSSIELKKSLIEDDLKIYFRLGNKRLNEQLDRERVRNKIKRAYFFGANVKRYYEQTVGPLLKRQF